MPWFELGGFVFLCPAVGITCGAEGAFGCVITKGLKSPIIAMGFCSVSQY